MTRTETLPAPVREDESTVQAGPKFESMYNVVLIDDDDHTYQYVVAMLCTLFGVGFEMAYMMACAVDADGRVIVHSTDRDTARRKRDEIKSFGPDPLMPNSIGSMHAIVEPLAA